MTEEQILQAGARVLEAAERLGSFNVVMIMAGVLMMIVGVGAIIFSLKMARPMLDLIRSQSKDLKDSKDEFLAALKPFRVNNERLTESIEQRDKNQAVILQTILDQSERTKQRDDEHHKTVVDHIDTATQKVIEELPKPMKPAMEILVRMEALLTGMAEEFRHMRTELIARANAAALEEVTVTLQKEEPHA